VTHPLARELVESVAASGVDPSLLAHQYMDDPGRRFGVDIRAVRTDLEAVPAPIRAQIKHQLRKVAGTLGLTRVMTRVGPGTMFWLEVAGFNVGYQIDAVHSTVRTVSVSQRR
jgi:mRNA-degrading endonuclease RelE of RelBE toxin-antitoxin system